MRSHLREGEAPSEPSVPQARRRFGARRTVVAKYYRRQGVDLDAVEAAVEARNRTPLRTPVTAIYSRADGVVAWRACIDPWNPHVEHVQVAATHIGLGFSPEVFEIVAQRLARRGEGAPRSDNAKVP